jgi:hypothetical protein
LIAVPEDPDVVGVKKGAVAQHQGHFHRDSELPSQKGFQIADSSQDVQVQALVAKATLVVEKFGQVDFDPADDAPFVFHDVLFC